MSRQPGKQHLNEKMSRNKNRDKSNMVLVSPSQMTNVKECLPNANIR